eukprot:gene6759-8382_t
MAVDGSEGSKSAIEEAIRVFKPTRDTVDIITVIDSDSIVHEECITDDLNRSYKIAQDILSESVKKFVDKGFFGINTYSPVGEIRDEIIKYMNEKGPFEMIIVGSRGLSVFKRIMLGSVSEYLVHHSPIPVYVVKGNHSQIYNQHHPTNTTTRGPSPVLPAI